MNIKPQPSPEYEPCSKCQGTGFFCLGINNGQPYSNTGFDCYSCNGSGWILKNHSIKAVASKPKTALTIEGIKQLLQDSQPAVEHAITVLYYRQTNSERNQAATHEHNGEGFSAVDAGLLTSYAEQILKGHSLTAKQMIWARKKIMKYSRQLLDIALTKQAAKQEFTATIDMSDVSKEGVAKFEDGFESRVYDFKPVRGDENEVLQWTYLDPVTNKVYAVIND